MPAAATGLDRLWRFLVHTVAVAAPPEPESTPERLVLSTAAVAAIAARWWR